MDHNEKPGSESQPFAQTNHAQVKQEAWRAAQEMVIPLRDRRRGVANGANGAKDSVAPVMMQGESAGTRDAPDTLIELQLLNSLLAGMVHAKNQFVTAMGLRLRSPLTTVVGYTEMLVAGEVHDADDQQMVYRDLLAAGRQLLDLVNDVIEFARVDAGDLHLQRTAVTLAYVLREATYQLEPLAGSRRQHIIVDVPAALPEVWADRRWMTQIVTKLGTNALRFSPTGSTVTLRAHVVDDDHVAVDVVDEGVGVRLEEGETIFQPFHEGAHATRAESGTGLELPLVKRLVELQDGMIMYTSKRGIGTIFTITLPNAGDW